jgi:serine protease Do
LRKTAFPILPLVLACAGVPFASAVAPPPPPRDPPLPAALTRPAPAGVPDLKAIQERVKVVLEKVVPATVGVVIGRAAGSGVIVSPDGDVLTAGHVSGEPDRPVTLFLSDGRRVKGKSLGNNRGIDSGMIKITDKSDKPWPFVALGDSTKLEPGTWCVAVGHPGGFKPGRTPVVRVGRVLTANPSLIRTDCALVGGDSGGPLCDMYGRVIGIHSRVGPSMESNIHVPVDTYKVTWDRLAKGETWGGFRFGFGGRGRRRPAAAPPYLGIIATEDTEELRLARVVPDSPAARAGLQADDVLTRFDGKKVANLEGLRELLARKKAGDEVNVEVERDGEPMTLKVKLGAQPE